MHKIHRKIGNIITNYTVFCLENFVVQNGDLYIGTIIGKNWFLIENNAVHYVTVQVLAKTKTTKLFEHYSYKTVFLSKTTKVTHKVKSQ